MADFVYPNIGELTKTSPIDASNIINEQLRFRDAGKALIGNLPGGDAGAAVAKQARDADIAGNNLVIAAQQAAKARTMAANFGAAARFGTTPDAPGEAINAAMELADKSSAEFLKRSKDIQERSSKSFLDNPVDWVVNQISLPFEIDSANKFAHTANAARDFISGQVKLTQEQVVLNNIARESASASESEGLSLIARAAADKAYSAALFEKDRIGVSGLNIRNAVNNEIWNSVITINNAYASEQTRLLTIATTTVNWATDQRTALQQEFDKNMRVLNLEIERKRLGLSEVADKRAADATAISAPYNELQLQAAQDKRIAMDILDKRFSRMSAVLGIEQMSFKTWDLMPEGPAKRNYLELAQSPEVQLGAYGTTPIAALAIMDKLNIPGSAGVRYTSELIRKEQDKILIKLGTTLKTVDEKAGGALITEAMSDVVKVWTGNKEVEGNPYAPAGLQSILAIPIIGDSSLAPYLRNLSNSTNDPNGLYRTQSKDFLEAAIFNITKKGIDIRQVAYEIANAYKSIAVDVNDTRGLVRFGLPLNNTEKSGYMVSVGTTGKFRGGSMTLDMTNELAIQAYILREISARAALIGQTQTLR